MRTSKVSGHRALDVDGVGGKLASVAQMRGSTALAACLGLAIATGAVASWASIYKQENFRRVEIRPAQAIALLVRAEVRPKAALRQTLPAIEIAKIEVRSVHLRQKPPLLSYTIRHEQTVAREQVQIETRIGTDQEAQAILSRILLVQSESVAAGIESPGPRVFESDAEWLATAISDEQPMGSHVREVAGIEAVASAEILSAAKKEQDRTALSVSVVKLSKTKNESRDNRHLVHHRARATKAKAQSRLETQVGSSHEAAHAKGVEPGPKEALPEQQLEYSDLVHRFGPFVEDSENSRKISREPDVTVQANPALPVVNSTPQESETGSAGLALSNHTKAPTSSELASMVNQIRVSKSVLGSTSSSEYGHSPDVEYPSPWETDLPDNRVNVSTTSGMDIHQGTVEIARLSAPQTLGDGPTKADPADSIMERPPIRLAAGASMGTVGPGTPAMGLLLRPAGSGNGGPAASAPVPVPQAESRAVPPVRETEVTEQAQSAQPNLDAAFERLSEVLGRRHNPGGAQRGDAPLTSRDREEPQDGVQLVSTAFSGRIVEAFSGGKRAVPGAVVQILGTELHAETTQDGTFSFPQVRVEGVLPVIVRKANFRHRQAELTAGGAHEIELLHENAVSLTGQILDEAPSNQNGYLFGQIESQAGESVAGLRVILERTDSEPVSPVYLSQAGIPSKELAETTTAGQFILFNIPKGSFALTIIDRFGKEKATHLVHVGAAEGLVRKFSLGEPRYITGRVWSASNDRTPVGGATVRVLGSSQTAHTDRLGRFSLGPLYIDCASLTYIQVEKSGFYRNRLSYACPENPSIASNFYVFPGAAVDAAVAEAGAQLAPSHAVIMGHASYSHPVKVQLWGPDEGEISDSIRGKDFYYDADGVLNRGREYTSQNGNFALLEAPQGLSYLQTFDRKSRTLSYWPIVTAPSTVSVHIQ